MHRGEINQYCILVLSCLGGFCSAHSFPVSESGWRAECWEMKGQDSGLLFCRTNYRKVTLSVNIRVQITTSKLLLYIVYSFIHSGISGCLQISQTIFTYTTSFLPHSRKNLQSAHFVNITVF